MILGSYPCCEGPLALDVPDMTPAFSKERCPHCGAVVWHKFSRVDPCSWTEADFLSEYVVDDATHQIEPRHKLPGPRPEMKALLDAVRKDATEMAVTAWVDGILYGESDTSHDDLRRRLGEKE